MVDPAAAPGHPLIAWRGDFENGEVNALHATCFEHRLFEDDWRAQVDRFSLGWVTARIGPELVGFVNVAWDGGVHAFILDTMVLPEHRRKGIAKAIVEAAIEHARGSPCEWLHVDFEPHLRAFYFGACGFPAIDAGALALKGFFS